VTPPPARCVRNPTVRGAARENEKPRIYADKRRFIIAVLIRVYSRKSEANLY